MYDPDGGFFPPYGTTLFGSSVYGVATYDSVEDLPRSTVWEEHRRQNEGHSVADPSPQFVDPPDPRPRETVVLPHVHGLNDPSVHGLNDPSAPAAPRADGARSIRAHRRARSQAPQWVQALGFLFGALTTATFAVVCVISWMLSYHPLQDLAASRAPHGLSHLWPVILYGPWLASCLSVLRAALDGRRVLHSWIVLTVFSLSSTALCVADVTRTVPDMVVAGLPPLTTVVSLHQLVRQLGSDRHRLPKHTVHRAR